MTKALWVFAVLALLSVGYGVWEGHSKSRAEVTRDSMVAVSRVKDSLVGVAVRHAQQDSGRVDSLGRVTARLRARGDSLVALLGRPHPVPRPDTTVRDSLRYWRDSASVAQTVAETALNALQARQTELGALRGQLEAETALAGHLRDALTLQTSRADGLEATLRKMPVGCRRIPVLGIPIPKVGIGAALTTHGLEPAVAIIVPLGGC